MAKKFTVRYFFPSFFFEWKIAQRNEYIIFFYLFRKLILTMSHFSLKLSRKSPVRTFYTQCFGGTMNVCGNNKHKKMHFYCVERKNEMCCRRLVLEISLCPLTTPTIFSYQVFLFPFVVVSIPIDFFSVCLFVCLLNTLHANWRHCGEKSYETTPVFFPEFDIVTWNNCRLVLNTIHNIMYSFAHENQKKWNFYENSCIWFIFSPNLINCIWFVFSVILRDQRTENQYLLFVHLYT